MSLHNVVQCTSGLKHIQYKEYASNDIWLYADLELLRHMSRSKLNSRCCVAYTCTHTKSDCIIFCITLYFTVIAFFWSHLKRYARSQVTDGTEVWYCSIVRALDL